MKTANQTTTTAKTLDEVRAERNRNTAEAFASCADLYTVADTATYTAIKARHSKNGLLFLAQLQNAQTTDNRTRNAPQIAVEIDELKAKAQRARAEQNTAKAKAKQITRAPEERAYFYTIAKAHKRTADKLTDRIKTFETALERCTYSDRADIVQEAVLTALEAERTPEEVTTATIEKYLAKHTAENIDPETIADTHRRELQASANFRAVTNSAGRAISKLSAPDAHNSTTTKAEPISPEAIAEYITRYGDEVLNGLKIPHTTKRTSTSQCYITIEEREYTDRKTKEKKKGWYKITHYATIAPYQYIEDFSTTDENGENDIAYLKTFNPFVDSYADLETLEALAERDGLNIKQRLFLHYFATRCRFDSNFYSVRKWAFSQMGIKSERTQRYFFNKLLEALKDETAPSTRRHSNTPDIIRATDSTARIDLLKQYGEYKCIKCKDENGEQLTDSNGKDLCQWVYIPTDSTQPDSVINWTTATEAEAQHTAHAEALQQIYSNSHIDNSTLDPTETHAREIAYKLAQITANRYSVNPLTTAEVLDIERRYNKHKARAEATAKARARAEALKAQEAQDKAEAQTAEISVQAWNSWTPEKRLVHINYCIANHLRTKFID